MAASFSTKTANIPAAFFKRTGELLGGATTDYFKEVMPVTSSTISEAKSTFSSANQTLSSNMQSIMPHIRGMKLQSGIRSVVNWFMGSEEEFGAESAGDNLSFDTNTDEGAGPTSQITEMERVSNQVSRSVVESNRHLFEGQMQLTANLVTSIDKQTAVISTGFDKTNETLNKILEVVTKNTAAMIEVTTAANKVDNPAQNMLSSGKFNFNEYKKIIEQNIKSSPEMGMAAAFLPMLTNPTLMKQMMTPEAITSMIFSGVMNKKAPNLKKNLQALDEAVNETIMSSLVRLGENKSNPLARLFGIDSTRKSYTDNQRSSLELKAVPFDTITKESITNAIPGYLRKILVQLGGPDVVYDHRTRSFRSQGSIQRSFMNQTTQLGSLSQASRNVQRAFAGSKNGNLLYDLMMVDIGYAQNNYNYGKQMSQARATTGSFDNAENVMKYIDGLLQKNGVSISASDQRDYKKLAENIAKLNVGQDIHSQATRSNAQRSQRVGAYLKEADAYNVDISKLKSDITSEMNHVLESYGKKQAAEIKVNSGDLVGVDYTNRALYELYRLMDRGVNVYQVGSSTRQTDPYERLGDKYLQAPKNYRAKPHKIATYSAGYGANFSDLPDDDNLLKNLELEDGSMENLSRGERLGRWGKNRGGQLMKALFTGNPEQVKQVFGLAMHDVTEITGDAIKSGAQKINDSFGNVTGYLNHKFFGSGYEYTDEKGNHVVVKKKENGGVFGFLGTYIKDMFNGPKNAAKDWIKSVASYFDYDYSPDDNKTVAAKRKKLINTSVGAMAGAGILGGPIGLIMGGLAGSALSGLDIGGKIKDMLLGIDGKTGKPTGILSKAADSIVTPIKYQFAKTANTLGNVLKEKVLGPISDIGVAIRERATKMAEDTFGKAFKFIGNALMAPFKLIGKVIMAPFNMVAGLTRGVVGVSGAAAGGVLGGIANLFAGDGTHKEYDEDGNLVEMSTKDYLKQRRKERKATYKKNKKFMSYEDFKVSENERRKRIKKAWDDSFDDEVEVYSADEWAAKMSAKQAEEMAKQNETTEDIRDDVSTLAELGSHAGSIFTHDQGIHDRLDTIISILSGGRIKPGDNYNYSDLNVIDLTPDQYAIDGKTGEKLLLEDKIVRQSAGAAVHSDNEAFGNSALPALATIISEGNITDEDQRLFGATVKEIAKPDSDNQIIASNLIKLSQSQEKDFVIQEEKKQSLWDKLMDLLGGAGGILGNLKDWLPYLLGLAGLGLALGNIKDVLGNIGDALGRGISLVFGGKDEDPNTDDSPVTAGVNAVTAWGDVKTKHWWDWVNPFANLNHVDNTAGGEAIKNTRATHDRNMVLYGAPLVNSTYQAAKFADANNAVMSARANTKSVYDELKSQGYTASQIKNMDAYKEAAGEWRTAKDNLGEAPSVTRNVGSGVTAVGGRMLVGAGIASAAGYGAGKLTNNIVYNLTGDEYAAQQAGQYAQYTGSALTTVGLVKNQATSAIKGKTSIIDKAIELIKGLGSWLAKHVKGIEKLGQHANALASHIDDVFNKSVGRVTDAIANKIVQGVAAITGKEVADVSLAAVTLGLSIAAGGIVGAISGGLSTENLFGVNPGQANALMTTVASLIQAVFGALEMTPGAGFFVSLFELVDDTLIKNILGKSLKQDLAEFLYGLLGGDKSKLGQLQGQQDADRLAYEEQYGSEISSAAFNDLVNTNGIIDKVLRGSAKVDANGNIDMEATFDEAGNRKNFGLKGLISGNDTVYARDDQGNLVIGPDGKPVRATDQYGNVIKRNEKIGDKVGRGANAVKRFFAGGDIYETDENGQAVLDANGNPIVASHEKNVFGKIGDGLGDLFGGVIKDVQSFGSQIAAERKTAEEIFKDKESSFSDLVKIDWEPSEGNFLGGIMKNILTITRLSIIPGAFIRKIGRLVKGPIDKVINDAKNIGSQIATANFNIHQAMMRGDSAGMAVAAAVNGNDLYSPFILFINGVNAAMRTPLANLIGVGLKLKEGIETIIANTKNSFAVLSENYGTIQEKAAAGEFSEMWGTELQISEENNPVGLVTKFIFGVQKVLLSPTALLHLAGNKIYEKFHDQIDTIVSAQSTLDSNVEQLHETANTGDLSALSDATYEGDESNPLNGIMGGIFSVHKFFSYPRALFHAAGNKIGEVYNNMKSAISEDRGTLESFREDLKQKADDGNYKDAFGAKISLNEKDPINGIFGAVAGIYNIFYGLGALVNAMGKKIGDFFGSVKDGIAGALNGFWDWLKSDDEEVETSGGAGARGGATSTQVIPPIHDGKIQMPGISTLLSMIGVGGPVGGNPLSKSMAVTSGYGNRTYPYEGYHEGIDIIPADGSGIADVMSQYEGTVSYVKNGVNDSDTARYENGRWVYSGANSGGNEVWIDTPDGYRIKNMHLKNGSIPSGLKRGDIVGVGSKIGEVGSTGWSTANHLHYQMELNGKSINPLGVGGPADEQRAEQMAMRNGGNPSDYMSSSKSSSSSRSDADQQRAEQMAMRQFSRTGGNGMPSNVANILDSQNASSSEISGYSDFVDTSSIASTETATTGGPLAQLLTKLKEVGSGFLSALTGGLITGVSDASSAIGGVADGIAGGFGTNASTWLAIVQAVKQAVAAKNPTYNHSGYIDIVVNGKNIHMRTDCSGYVSACLIAAGLATGMTSTSGMTSGSMYMKNTGFQCVNWPGWDGLHAGDILVTPGSHTEIFSHNEGGRHFVYNAGSTSALRSPGATGSSKANYQLVWRPTAAMSATYSGAAANATGTNRPLPSGLGKSKTYMGWQMITSPSSNQYKLRAAAGQNFDSNGFGKINGRYVVAMKPYFGNVGDYVDVTLDNGQTIQAIIGDIKGNENAGVSFSQYAHGNTVANSNVVEFVVDKPSWYHTNRTVVGFHPEWNSTVKSVANRGSYWGTGGSKSQLVVPMIGGPRSQRVVPVGGSNNSMIIPSNYTNNIRRVSGVGGSTSGVTVGNTYRPLASTNLNISTNNAGTVASTDLSGIIHLMNQVVTQLNAINNNTGTSSDLLEELNGKEFVDSDLRNTLTNLGKVSKRTSVSTNTSSSNNARNVASIAAP